MDTHKKSKKTGILYIEKDKASIYAENFVNPFVITFSDDIVKNLEILDADKLNQLVSAFIEENKLEPLTLYMVLANDVIFEKRLENVPLSLQAADTEKFLNMVPVNTLLTKAYTFSKKTIVIAASKDFCDGFITAFAEDQFSVVGCIPYAILEEKFPQLKNTFDERFLLKKMSNLKQYFLPLGVEAQEKLLSYDVPSFKNLQFVGLVSIFALLLIILIIQAYTQLVVPMGKPKTVKQVIIPTAVPTQTPTPTVPLNPSPSPTSGFPIFNTPTTGALVK